VRHRGSRPLPAAWPARSASSRRGSASRATRARRTSRKTPAQSLGAGCRPGNWRGRGRTAVDTAGSTARRCLRPSRGGRSGAAYPTACVGGGATNSRVRLRRSGRRGSWPGLDSGGRRYDRGRPPAPRCSPPHPVPGGPARSGVRQRREHVRRLRVPAIDRAQHPFALRMAPQLHQHVPVQVSFGTRTSPAPGRRRARRRSRSSIAGLRDVVNPDAHVMLAMQADACATHPATRRAASTGAHSNAATAARSSERCAARIGNDLSTAAASVQRGAVRPAAAYAAPSACRNSRRCTSSTRVVPA